MPFCAPYLLTAAKLALAYAFIGVIAPSSLARSGRATRSLRYTNFDNATMYPILLILLMSVIMNSALSRWESCCSRVGASNDGLRRTPLRNAIVLIAGVRCWQIAYWMVGDTALRSPWQTMRFTVELTHTHLFWLHLTTAAGVRGGARDRDRWASIGFGLGLPAFGRCAGADACRAVFDSQDHAISDPAAASLGMSASRVRRDPRNHSSRAVHAQRGARHQADPAEDWRVLSSIRPRWCARSLPAAVPEIHRAGGFSLTLIGTVLGEMFAAQHGLGFADERDRAIQRRRHHVGDVLLVVVTAGVNGAARHRSVAARGRSRVQEPLHDLCGARLREMRMVRCTKPPVREG
jgi:NitT/TauT family transport system permease protein